MIPGDGFPCGCDSIYGLNELGSWLTSNGACLKPDFQSEEVKIDPLVHIKCTILLFGLTTAELLHDKTYYFGQKGCTFVE